MTWIDYSMIGAYAVGIVVMGAWFARSQNTYEDYLLGGRSMGWLVIGISQLASLLSAISYLGAPGESYGHGLLYVVFNISGYLVIPLVIYLYLNFFFRLRIVSIYEYLERRFNYATRCLASFIFILDRLCWMATIVSAVSIAIETLTGLEPWKCIVATAAVATLYTTVGGMKAIIWTDVVQFLLFAAGLVGALVLIGRMDSPAELVTIAFEAGKLQIWDFQFDPTVRLTFWIGITAGMVAGLANMTDQVSMQRYLSARSLREARKAVWFKPLLGVPVMAMLYAMGLALYGHYQLHPERAVGISGPDNAFPHFILHEMPPGMSGLIIAAVFAAAMSSIDSGIHTLSTVCIEDFYKRLIRPAASDRHYLLLAKWLTLTFGVLITCIALAFARIGSIFDMMASLAAPFFGCAVGIFILGTSTRRATAWGTFCGALIGYACVLWVKFGIHQVDGHWHPTPWTFDEQAAVSVKTISKFWLPFVSFAGTVVSGYLISLTMSHPTSTKLLGLNIWDHKD